MNTLNGDEYGCVKPLAIYSKPVNLQAARVFWKSPWWAKLLTEDKEEILRIETKLEDLVDITQPPPFRPGGGHNQIPDIRGTKVKHKKHGLVALVMGYAYADRVKYKKLGTYTEIWWENGFKSANTKSLEHTYRNEHRWYAFFEGEVNIIIGRKWGMAGNYEPITPAPMMPLKQE